MHRKYSVLQYTESSSKAFMHYVAANVSMQTVKHSHQLQHLLDNSCSIHRSLSNKNNKTNINFVNPGTLLQSCQLWKIIIPNDFVEATQT